MPTALHAFFDEQVQFRLLDGTEVEGGILIGNTEFLPLEVLRDDADAYHEEFQLWLGEVWRPTQQQRRDEILALHANKKRYADLSQAVARQQVVPFVGSGMSVASGLPTWSDFLRGVRAYTPCAPADLEGLLEAHLFEEAADLLAACANPRLLTERVEHDLRVDGPIGGAARLLPALFPSLVITTNLDDVLEQVYVACGRAFEHVLVADGLAQYRSLKSPTLRFLLKLHGDASGAAGRVLLSREYDQKYAPESTLRDELTLLYRHYHLLFLGCSLGADRTVGLIEAVAKSDVHMPRHYCILPLPDADTVRIRRENFLSQRGICPIWYDSPHDESLTALLDGLIPTGAGQIPR